MICATIVHPKHRIKYVCLLKSEMSNIKRRTGCKQQSPSVIPYTGAYISFYQQNNADTTDAQLKCSLYPTRFNNRFFGYLDLWFIKEE